MSKQHWTMETAITYLQSLIDEIPSLKNKKRYSSEHVNWNMRTLSYLEEVFGGQSRYYLSFAAIEWGKSGSFFITDPLSPQAAVERMHQEAYVQKLDSAKGFLTAALSELKRKGIEEVYSGKDTPPESSEILRVINLAEHKLRKVIREIPEKEVEVQNAFENLLIGADIAYSRETESIEYSSKTYTPDFTIQKINLAIEIKLCHKDRREKEIIAEINDYILPYQTIYGNLLFIVHDVGFIRDVDRFCSSYEQNENVLIRVIKH